MSMGPSIPFAGALKLILQQRRCHHTQQTVTQEEIEPQKQIGMCIFIRFDREVGQKDGGHKDIGHGPFADGMQ